MDRVTQLRGEAGPSKDSSFDSSSAQSEAYLTANESSKYFSLSEESSSFDISPIKDVSLNSAAADVEKTIIGTDQLIANLSPISKQNELLDSYKFGKQIEAANILSGGVDIFDDNENSYDGDGLVIDDNVVDTEDKSNPEPKDATPGLSLEKEDDMTLVDNVAETSDVASKDTEIVLQIDGKNVNAINIGNGLYLYRKEGQEELAAVQIIDDDQQQPSFKFLKVRENAEGNLEVYEEIEIEVPKETPAKDGKQIERKIPSLPTNEKSIVNPEAKTVQAVQIQTPTELTPAIPEIKPLDKEITIEPRTDNINNKMNKFNETRKSPVIHSTPNKEGIPLTKTMVDQQLHPNRHLDKVKTIEVHTDTTKQKLLDMPTKSKETLESAVHATGSSSIEPVETAVKQFEINKSTDTQIQAAPDSKLETEKSTKQAESSSTQEAESTEKPQKQAALDSKSELKKSKQSENSCTQEENTSKKEIKIAYTDINKAKKETSVSKETLGKTADPTGSSYSKIHDSLEHPKRDISQNVEGSKEVGSKTDTFLNPTSKNSSEVTTSSNVADEVNEKLENIVKLENINTDNTKVNTEPIPIRNANSKTSKLQKENDLDNAIEVTIQKPTVGTSKITKDIKSIDKIKDIDLPQTINEKDGKVVEIKSPVKGENMKVFESTNTKGNKTADLIQCKTQPEHDTDVMDCIKPVLHHQIPPVTALEQKVKPTANSNVGKKETTFTGPVKFEKQSTQEYPKLPQNNTMATPSSSVHEISGSKKVETKTPTIFQSEKLNKIQNLFADINKVTQKIVESTKIPMKVTSDDIKTSIIGDTKCVPLNFSLGFKVPPTLISSSRSSHSSDTKTVVPQTSGQVEGMKDKIISHNIGDKATAAQFRSIPILKSEASQPIPEKKLEISKVAPPKTNLMPVTVRSLPDTKMNIKRDVVTVRASTNFEINPNNNNHTAAVPFGKWTEANRQEFLNRFKDTKVPTTQTNAKQIKQPTDLNKREFLQKIDIQRQNTNTTVKLNQRRVAPKLNVKTETKTFANKPIVTPDVTLPVKIEASGKVFTVASKPDKIITKAEVAKPSLQTVAVSQSNITVAHDNTQQKRNQELIDKTIEGIINRVITIPPEDLTPSTSSVVPTEREIDIKLNASRTLDQQVKNKHPASLDAIEMKMNELHGIPFIERPPHQLPKPFSQDVKTYSKADTNKAKVTSTSSVSTSHLQKNDKQNVIDVDSEEEIIEHEPVTGDMDIKTKLQIKPQVPTQSPASKTVPATTSTTKNEAIITEKDFDKFARRNSVTYENQLTVNFEATESYNAVPKIVEKDLPPTKKFSRNELLLAEAKEKSDQKQQHRINHPNKITPKPANDDAQNKHYQSKLQIAYQSALTAKRKIEPPPPPVLVLEDKPVKVLLVDESSGITTSQLNVQGKELSPKKKISDIDVVITTTNDSQHPDLIENVESKKEQDDIKVKGRHQRKQVLTPVDTPELELIEPRDLGLTGSPKKKRRTIEPPLDESPKNVPLKNYLLGQNKVAEETESPPQDLSKAQIVRNNPANVTDTATAIDNLVKAAELLETQSENLNLTSTFSVDSQVSQPTPLKRGRGRPRKYPLGGSPSDKSKAESPQKRTRLIEATPTTPRKESTPTDEDTSDEEMIRENWTMGKINENIVCPICKKLFRSENVVFKHVKHCTGPSPNRSESDNVSRKSIQSQESETKSLDSKFEDVDYEPPEEKKSKKVTPKKRKSKDAVSEPSRDVDDIIVIEDTPKPKLRESRISSKTKPLPKDSLACDICGKKFRQLSYLVSHKWQHKKEQSKKVDDLPEVAAKSVFCCEVCKKEFRKLHHLVQHRLIHNPTTASIRSSRKSSFENIEQRSKNAESSKPAEDPSAGFRCEPCDKSFRKLHHLVEHRETHDGQNRQKSIPAASAPEDKTSDPPPQCDICKKTFRKLHHLIEHKEQHLETTSEKSDDKSVKSSLSTKDIIHECRLCYMVFPNEHSLNKHSVFCQRKKKPAVQLPQLDDEEEAIVIDSPEPVKEQVITDTPKPATEENIIKKTDISPEPPQPSKPISSCAIQEVEIVKTPEKVPTKENTTKLNETTLNNATDKQKLVVSKEEVKETALEIPTKSKKIEEKIKETPPKSKKIEEKVKDTPPKSKNIEDKAKKLPIVKTVPKRKTPVKEKVTVAAIKRPKPTNMPLPAIKEVQSMPESSDDEEVRYMLNPDYKCEPSRLFMEVRANKRSSLQIEKPNKESVKRRASLQQPPKIPRFKPAVVEDKAVATKSTAFTTNTLKIHKPEPVPSTDSDDSDVKYSFPETVTDKSATTSDPAKTKSEVKRKSITNKRKSLSGMAKRKSLGKPPVHKQKEISSAPVKLVKRRTLGVEHRCDCGQLFSSAALLSRHTTLSHTPPRIRRRRSPPPPPVRAQPPPARAQPPPARAQPPPARAQPPPARAQPPPARAQPPPARAQPTTRKSADSRTSTDHAKTTKNPTPGTTKSVNTDKTPRKRKTSGKKDESAKSTKSAPAKSRAAHRGVPVPEKMKKLAEKLNF